MIIRQVAQGIKVLHSRLIIHRDIKLENLLMTDNTRHAQGKIADFGSAVKFQSADETSDFMIGTPGYTAPEIMTGQNYSFSADMWSLGSLMHALLSARLPF